jgi:plastocyanin
VRTGALCLLIVAALAVDASRAQRKDGGGTTHTVVISGTAFKPATLTVNVGDRIEWKNDDPFAHTVTSSEGHFDSKAIAAGQTWTYRVNQKGQFPYLCTLHRTMKGTLVVR